ncbi:MAG: hypothetical protein ACREDR_02985 [Blastocatellia bacterium]
MTGLDYAGGDRLFNPRSDPWDSHFSFKKDSGVIDGLSIIGRGTVARLRMNAEIHLAARLQWSRLGLFP